MIFYHNTWNIYYLMLGFYFAPILLILLVTVFQTNNWTKTFQHTFGSVFVVLMQVYLFYFGWIFYLKTAWHFHSHKLPFIVPTLDSFRFFLQPATTVYDFVYIVLDSVNTPLVFLNIIIITLSVYYTIFSSTGYKQMQTSVLSLLTAMILMNILFTTTNLGVFYITFELLIIPLFFLIGQGTRLRRLRATMLFLIYTIFFSYVMLFGLIYAWVWFGTLHYPKLFLLFHLTSGTKLAVYVFWIALLIAFLAKIPLMPFHLWLPEAHVEATAVGSVILAGLILKIGAYGIIRFLLPLHSLLQAEWLLAIIGFIGLLSAVYATIMTLAQVDLKRIIAYSSIAHLSFAIAGIFTNTKTGVLAAYYYNIGHGFVSAGLFFLAGMLYKRYGTRLLKYYSGLAGLPYLSAALLFFSFANIGFPGTVNFIAEFLLVVSFTSVNSFLAIFLIFLIFFGSLTFSLWTYLRIAGGSLSVVTLLNHYDLEAYEVILLSVLVSWTCLYGLFPDLLFTRYFKIY